MFRDSAFYTLGLYGAVGIQLAASVVAGLAFGAWLDKKIETSPWFALVGTILGAVGGIWNLVRILKWNERKNVDQNGNN
jgi:F0F1-type ATP synthase assembly protein I